MGRVEAMLPLNRKRMHACLSFRFVSHLEKIYIVQ